MVSCRTPSARQAVTLSLLDAVFLARRACQAGRSEEHPRQFPRSIQKSAPEPIFTLKPVNVTAALKQLTAGS
jgi:hypothetical protein